MEIINEYNPRRRTYAARLYTGIVLVLAGLVWMLGNFGLLPWSVTSVIFTWQALLVAVGGLLLITRRTGAGIVMVLFGALFYVMEYTGLDVRLEDVLLPAVLIAVGSAILLARK